jgi:hypothetical protein
VACLRLTGTQLQKVVADHKKSFATLSSMTTFRGFVKTNPPSEPRA